MLGIKPSMSTKGMGFFAQGYLWLYKTYGDPAFLDKARYCLRWLRDNRCPQFRGNAWGNHFPYQSRGGAIPKGTPTIVWTGLIGNAFLDAYDFTGDEEYLAVARGACDFIVDELGSFEGEGGICLRYYPNEEHQIHNSNVIGASLLARVNALRPDARYSKLAQSAVDFTVSHQTAEGAWYYGVEPKYRWVDSFHTGYVLEALDIFNRSSGSAKHAAALEKGYRYFVETFFGEDGTPRYYDYKTRPLDIQCASQGIQTLVNLRRFHPRSVEVAGKVAEWTIANMQDRTGYFYYRKYPFITNKTPTLHWGQATMFAALALLDHHLRSQSGTSAALPASKQRGTAMPPQTACSAEGSPGRSMSPQGLSYVLITPARNEQDFIELTIKSVINQSLRPMRWVIVSDGSTDATDDIVKGYAAQYDWIELHRMPERKERHYGGKAACFNAGYDRVKNLSWDIIGNLDADISFDTEFFSFLLARFAENSQLGVAGASLQEDGVTYDFRFSSTDHVSGPCQLFRRDCFETIGGYTPAKGGGIDVIAVLTARMKGWQARTFPEKIYVHHRAMGSAKHNAFGRWFELGEKDYRLGRHPLWQVLRSVYQMKYTPIVLGGCALLMGYLWLWLRRVPRSVSPEVVAFQRREQMQRLAGFIRRVIPFAGESARPHQGPKVLHADH